MKSIIFTESNNRKIKIRLNEETDCYKINIPLNTLDRLEEIFTSSTGKWDIDIIEEDDDGDISFGW